MRRLLVLALVSPLLAAACGSPPGGLYGDGTPTSDGGASPDGEQPAGDCANPTGSRRDQVCLRWTCGRADMSEGAFAGNIASCSAGTPNATARANTMRVLNAYRFIAGLPDVTEDAALGGKAQACSLMMDANDALSHTPPQSWKCWTQAGAEAAGKSNISTGAAVMSIDMYMKDFGNEDTMGHRRWILSNSLGPVGVGSAPRGSCLWVIGGSGKAGAAWTAFPSPGAFPVQAINPGTFGDDVDEVGWTVQSDTVNVTNADAVVTRDGQPVAVDSFPLPANYGSRYAMRFTPRGWRTQAGHTYHVKLDGTAVEYDVEVVDCQ